MRLIAVVCAAAALAGASAGAPVALAAVGNAVINDCESNGQLTHPYTLQELQHALAVMPASIKQYTNCYDVIQEAILKSHGRTGSAGTSSGSSFLPTPVIVILVVLILAAITFGAIAVRRRATANGGSAGSGGRGGSGGSEGSGGSGGSGADPPDEGDASP
jgi:hypothetical protein